MEFRTLGFDGLLEFPDLLDPRTGEKTRTRFVPHREQDGNRIGKIIVGPDIMPGKGTNPNSFMDRFTAIAHEITHFRRWEGGMSCDDPELEELDEAQTDLQAACYFRRDLNASQVESLITDALERLILLERRLEGGGK